ncbi:hypothetical protein ACFFJ7_06655 [Pseudochelatococcus lubricantis]|uniref:hypothetical protein n=1 Tax=Pseudochelatococcus lubricantis TaxID=1538102 RepID=UPI0035E85D09
MISEARQKDWHQDLDRLISRLAATRPGRNVDLRYFYDKLAPPSKRALMEALMMHVLEGDMRVCWRVLDPETGDNLGEFDSFENVPETIQDHFGHSVVVDPMTNLQELYQPVTRSPELSGTGG